MYKKYFFLEKGKKKYGNCKREKKVFERREEACMHRRRSVVERRTLSWKGSAGDILRVDRNLIGRNEVIFLGEERRLARLRTEEAQVKR